MNISLVVENITQSILAKGDRSDSSLTLKCSRSEGDDVLEIGQTHAFASKGARVERGRTHLSEMRLFIRRKSALTEKDIDRLALNDGKIGELGFYPPHEKTWDVPAFPASLEAFIFFADPEFDGILRSITSATPGITVSLYIDKPPSIKYGWEPDGSRVVWTIGKPSEPAYAPVSQAEIELALYKRPR